MRIWMECIRGGYVLIDLNEPPVWWRSGGRVKQTCVLEMRHELGVSVWMG